MVSWGDLARAEPTFTETVRACFTVRKHCTLATLRRDGSPRISGIEVAFDNEVLLGMMLGSAKAGDVLRDPRMALHSPTVDPPEDNPAGWVGEAKLAGRAVPVETPGGEGHTFRVDIREASVVRVAPSGDHLLIDSWHPERGLTQRKRR